MDDPQNKTETDNNMEDDNLEDKSDTNADENHNENVDDQPDETTDDHPADDVLRNETEDTSVPEDNNETPPALNSDSSYDKPSTEEKIESASVEKGSKDLTETNSQIDKDKEPAPFVSINQNVYKIIIVCGFKYLLFFRNNLKNKRAMNKMESVNQNSVKIKKDTLAIARINLKVTSEIKQRIKKKNN